MLVNTPQNTARPALDRPRFSQSRRRLTYCTYVDAILGAGPKSAPHLALPGRLRSDPPQWYLCYQRPRRCPSHRRETTLSTRLDDQYLKASLLAKLMHVAPPDALLPLAEIDREAASRLLTTLAKPSIFRLAEVIRGEYPSWPFSEVYEYTRRISEEVFDDYFHPAFEKQLEQQGGNAYQRYREIVFDQPRRRPSSTGDHAAWEKDQRDRYFQQKGFSYLAEPDGTVSAGVREVTLRAIADRISWRVSPQRVKDALVARARDLGIGYEQAKRDVLLAGTLLVFTRWHEAQTHRFGEEWVKDESGKQAPIVPSTVPWYDAWDWMADEARKAARAILLDEPYPAVGGSQGDGQGSKTDNAPEQEPEEPPELRPHPDVRPEQREEQSALHVLLEGEEEDEHRRALRILLDQHATETERRVYELLSADYSYHEVGRELGISPSTVRVHWHNLVKKAKTSVA